MIFEAVQARKEKKMKSRSVKEAKKALHASNLRKEKTLESIIRIENLITFIVYSNGGK